MIETPEKIQKDIERMFLTENQGRPLNFFQRMRCKQMVKKAIKQWEEQNAKQN